MESCFGSSSAVLKEGQFIYVQARLQGGAPWGFTLKGGLEHGEALIISKVEEGGKADKLLHPLLPGDEVISINEVELSGFRQEAISLVKGSYKTLTLTVRRETCQDLYHSESDTSPHRSPPFAHKPSQESRGCSGGVKLRIKNRQAHWSPSFRCEQETRGEEGEAMELLGAFYRRKLHRKQKKVNLSGDTLCKAPSETSVNGLATGLISKVLRFTARRSEPVSRPHSWHSTKLEERQQDPCKMQITQGTVGTPWHQTYHSSASTTDLSSYDPGFLRKSPDQYSSRGSMESLDHSHPAYSSCHQLYLSKSSNSIDHLHSKRDSAYSSFSNSSSIPEYPATAGPSFSKERSYSMESMLSQRGPEGLRQADMRYVRTVYDPQQGVSKEHDVSSSALLRNSECRAHAEARVRGASHRGSGSTNSAFNRHSIGPVWGQAQSRNSLESLRGAPAPPLRSDSYAAIRNHERPNSWSSLEQARSLRALQKGSRHHSVGSVASGKPSLGAEGQLHTVVEKSPESSPTTKPKQTLPQAIPTGRLMLPTGIYPVPPPEPHFAQVPISCPSSSVYPALVKENEYISQKDQGMEPVADRMAMENGYQSSTSSVSNQSLGFSQPKSSQQEDSGQEHSQTQCSHNIPQYKEVNTLPQIPCQDQSHGSVVQERRDPYTPVQRRGERRSEGLERSENQGQMREGGCFAPAEGRYHLGNACLQNSILFPEDQASSEISQEVQGSYDNKRNGAKVWEGDHRSQATPRCQNTSGAWQQLSDHPLTRLQNALKEVQRPVSPGGDQVRNSETPAAHLSVLEKVSQFERQGRQQSLRTGYGFPRLGQAPVNKATFSTVEGVRSRRNISDGSSSKGFTDGKSQITEGKDVAGPEAYRQRQHVPEAEALHKHISSEADLPRSHLGKAIPLQRSKSSFYLSEENDKEFHWKDDLQDILGTIQDTSFNRAYRNSIKEAQSKVLRSTSFRRKDLSVTPVMPSKHLSLERKAPKTLPKPARILSPHTPKERHIVTPDEGRETHTVELPSTNLPARPPVSRIGSRKRLSLEQKKRSYSEPEKMNEVGLSAGENPLLSHKKGPQNFVLPETSVADKRKLFELAAKKNSAPSLPISRPELKQLQQNALAEYMERKTSQRVGGQHRPHSVYLQVVPSSDSQSLSPATSLASLQDHSLIPALQPNSVPEGSRASSTPWPSAQVYQGGTPARSQALGEVSLSTHRQVERPQGSFNSEQELNKTCTTPSEPSNCLPLQIAPCLQSQPNGILQRGAQQERSASAENILECSEKREVPRRSELQSSPSGERPSQPLASASSVPIDLSVTGDSRPLETVSKESSPPAQRESRPLGKTNDDQTVEMPRQTERYLTSQDSAQVNPPVMRRDRQRNTERQRAYSLSGLAASVGLPCPFSSPPSSTSLDWSTSDKMCQATLDSLTQSSLPFLPQGGVPDPKTYKESWSRTTQNSSDKSASEGIKKDSQGQRRPATPKTAPAYHTGEGNRISPSSIPERLLIMSKSSPSQINSPSFTKRQSLPSLRISESSLHFDPAPSSPQEDGEVFLPNPVTPTATCSSIRETDITEDIPTPPSPTPTPLEQVEVLQEAELQHLKSIEVFNDTAHHKDTEPETGSVSSRPLTSESTPREEEKPCSPAHSTEERRNDVVHDTKEIPEPQRPVFTRRERTTQELRAEVLARELVSRDKSLSPVLDTWAVQSTMDLMEAIFPTGALLPRKQRRRNQEEDSGKDRDTLVGERPMQNPTREMETDLDEEEADLNQKKVELVEALTLSLAELREERDGLAEDQRRNSALGSRVEALVQELCKPNERDKYRRFVGDVDKMVHLLLSLCCRLARVESSLSALVTQDTEGTTEERESLQQKRRQLCGQQEDARELKESLDHRERVVLDILGGYLSQPQLSQYQHFVRMKPALLIRQRLLDELIKQGEEQLRWLSENLPPEYRSRTEGLPSIPNPSPVPSTMPRSTAVTSL